jgi:hypothetical protein
VWVLTSIGFYSIACANKRGTREIDPEMVMIRARVRQHLLNLQKRFPALAIAKILALPGRDYRYRIVVPKATWVAVLKGLAEEQTWSNFKNQAARNATETGSAYVDTLHDVWGVMQRLQRP